MPTAIWSWQLKCGSQEDKERRRRRRGGGEEEEEEEEKSSDKISQPSPGTWQVGNYDVASWQGFPAPKVVLNLPRVQLYHASFPQRDCWQNVEHVYHISVKLTQSRAVMQPESPRFTCMEFTQPNLCCRIKLAAQIMILEAINHFEVAHFV